MALDYQPQDRSRRYIGLAVVVLLHVFVIWGLMTGLARKAIEVIKKPIEVAILDAPKPELQPPPPPRLPPPPAPNPPRLTDAPPVPTPTPTPPAPAPVVAAPEIVVPSTVPAPTIQVTHERAPEKVVEVRPAMPAPPPADAPVVRPAPRAEVGIVCPGYKEILNSALAGQWNDVGITGVVTVMIHIRGNQILDVTPQSGPREYYRAVQRAVRRFKCRVDGTDEFFAPLEISFREP
jgi:periplasmic protein TonB